MLQFDKLWLSGILAISVKFDVVILHLFIIFNAIPYTWVNGGIITNDSAALGISLSKIIIMLILMMVDAVACDLTNYQPKQWLRNVMFGFLVLSVGFDIFNLIMQLSGTSFERYILSTVGVLMLLIDIWVVYNYKKPVKFTEAL